jgi:hypothetical protein
LLSFFSRLLEELKVQFEIEKTYLVEELAQQREKAIELENLLEKQKLCNE